MPSEIVIVGAGYAGVSAYLDMHRHADRERYRVTLVNLRPYHTFTTELRSLAVGEATPEDVTVRLSRVVRPPHRLLVGEATALDVAARVLTVDGQEVPYDLALVAVGSVPEDYGLPGVHRHALTLTDVRSARRIKERLDGQAEAGGGRVVVVGGGLTGVELASEIRERYGPRLAVTIVEAGAEVMADIEPGLVRAARRMLAERGVEVRTATRVSSIERDRLVLRAPRREAAGDAPFDVLVWAAGVRGHPLLAISHLTVDRTGRGYVDAYLRSKDSPQVFLAGDCAAFSAEGGRVLPPTAQAAEQAGRHVADNLRRSLGMRPLTPFAPRIRGFFASVGEWRGVGELGREQFVGLPAAIVKHLVEAQHAYETGGMESLVKRLLRHGGRMLWGAGMGEATRRSLRRRVRTQDGGVRR